MPWFYSASQPFARVRARRSSIERMPGGPVHEDLIVRSLLERVEAVATAWGASSVDSFRVAVGELSGVEAALLRTAFESVERPVVCLGAVIEVVSVAARWRCPQCGQELHRGEFLRCPQCSLPAVLEAGAEVVLQRVELGAIDG